MNFGVRFCHSEYRLDMSDSDGDTSDYSGLATDVSIELSHLLLVNFIQFGVHEFSCVDYILLEEVLVYQVILTQVNSAII